MNISLNINKLHTLGLSSKSPDKGLLSTRPPVRQKERGQIISVKSSLTHRSQQQFVAPRNQPAYGKSTMPMPLFKKTVSSTSIPQSKINTDRSSAK